MNNLLKNKKVLIGGAIGVAVLLVIIICIVAFGKKKPQGDPAPGPGAYTQVQTNDDATKDLVRVAGIQGTPAGLAVSKDGTLLVTDDFNKVVWEVKNGEVTVLAGHSGPKDGHGEPLGGYNDASLLEARFENLSGIARYLDGWAVSDAKNRVIRYFDGELVRTAAYKDSERTLTHPAGLASDEAGNLYIADAGADLIYQMTPEGVLSVYADGFSAPCGLCYSNNTLYVADTGNHRICSVKDGQVTVIAGDKDGFRDGDVATACFQSPKGVAVGEDGLIYVADTGNSAIRVIRNGKVETLLKESADRTWPASPAALVPYEGGMAIADEFSGIVFVMPYAK